MIWVEFAGLVGSGKSTLAGRIRHRLNTLGYKAYTPSQAVQATLGRDPFARAAGRLPDGDAKYARWLSILTSIQFSFRHPGLIWQVYRSVESRSHLTNDHRRRILQYFYNVAGWYWRLGSQLGNESYVIADEGFFHRAINLFAWTNQPIQSTRIQKYLLHVPYVDLVVRLDAPVNVCFHRAEMRGLPSSLLAGSPEVVTRFMENSEEILDAAVQVLKQRNLLVVEVSNNGDIQEAEDQILEMMDDSGLLATARSTLSRLPATDL